MPTTSRADGPIVRAVDLHKRYGETKALDGLDLTAEAGQLTALLGPNGAGKTTFVSAIATLIAPDSGSLHVAGVDALAHPARVRHIIGLAGQYASVEPAMTGRENLRMVARLFGLNRHDARAAADRVLARLGLTDAGDRLVRTYSGGMRRRLDLGASLVGTPHLLLLDEPTTGLDPRSRKELWDAISELVADGTDVLLTTQYLEEADQLAKDIVIIDHGRVITRGTPSELKAQAGRDVVEVHLADPSRVAEVEEVLDRLSEETVRIDTEASRLTIGVDGPDAFVAAVNALAERQVPLEDIGLRRPTLDEVFLAVTGHPAGDDPAGDDLAPATAAHAEEARS